AEMTFVSPGEYALVATIRSTNDSTAQDTSAIDIAAPWMTVNISPLLALVVVFAAGILAYMRLVAKGMGRGGQRNEPNV
ncbi:MAG TPA: hypothetical protein VLA68_07435, partial [Nitrososphaera sp.]|nr:hypothetical protein [Nitrososphaera sp.]